MPTTPQTPAAVLSPDVSVNTAQKMPIAWRVFFSVFVSLLGIGIVLVLFPFLLYANEASDAGLVVVIFEAMLIPAVGVIALVTVIGLAVYMRRFHKPRRSKTGLVWLALKTLLLGVCLLFVALGVYIFYQWHGGWR